MALSLDRMSIEEAGMDPAALAAAVHRQLGDQPGPVPVDEIALALDIVEIRRERITGIEGALVTTPERDCGSILVNLGSQRQRQRFTVGHELLHFLNPLHKQTSPDGFQCRAKDMRLGQRGRVNPTWMELQEVEANRFSIELLAPAHRMAPFLRGGADFERIAAAANGLDISKQAAARRYIELHRDCLALVFAKEDKVEYVDWSDHFPRLRLRRGDRLPIRLSPTSASERLSTMDEADAGDWLAMPQAAALFTQILTQAAGHSITLLLAETGDPDDRG